MRKLPWVASVSLLFLAVGCATPHIHRLRWVEVRTPNFVLLSPMSPADAVELAGELELFRSVVEVVTGQPIPASPVPVRVFALTEGYVYQAFSVPGAAGYFASSMRESTIVVGSFRGYGVEARDILQHEYVHFLLRNRGRFAYPPWYDEGMAEFLGTVERDGDEVEIGRVARHRIPGVGASHWMPVEKLLALRSFEGQTEGQVAAFYAEAWAFVHYLYLGRKDAKARVELTRYLEALRAGKSNEEAVTLAFGGSSRSLGHQLVRYIERGQYTYLTAPLATFDGGEPPRARPLSEAEAAGALGGLSLTLEKFEQAEGYYASRLAAQPGDPRALTGLGRALSGQERFEEAAARFEEALALAPEDALVQLEFGNHLHARARAEEEDAEERARLAAQARQHYVRAWKLDDTIPETYARYGASFLLAGEDPSKGRESLEHAHSLLPSSPEIKLDLARLYAALGRPREARELAVVVSTWSHTPKVAAEVRAILDATAAEAAAGTAAPPPDD